MKNYIYNTGAARNLYNTPPFYIDHPCRPIKSRLQKKIPTGFFFSVFQSPPYNCPSPMSLSSNDKRSACNDKMPRQLAAVAFLDADSEYEPSERTDMSATSDSDVMDETDEETTDDTSQAGSFCKGKCVGWAVCVLSRN